MAQTIQAVVDSDGTVRLLERLSILGPCRARVTVFDDADLEAYSPALLSEAAFADWDRPEEEAAWAYLAVGSVVLVPYPFSDLTATKVRPAICIAIASPEDIIAVQITSNPFGDPLAIALSNDDFHSGGLLKTSFARPGKLITLHKDLVHREVGQLNQAAFQRVLSGVLRVLQPNQP